jgi:dienelactone hydrolase
MALADHPIEWIEFPYRGKSLPGIFHLPPNYRAGTRVPVIVAISGMDGFKERSVGLYKDAWMDRGYVVLAFEGPGYWEPPLRGIFVDVAGWADAARTVADWLVKRPEVDADKIGMTGVSYGSFFTAIMMAADPRYKACAVVGTCYEPGGETIFTRRRPRSKNASCSCRASPTSANSMRSAKPSTGTVMRRTSKAPISSPAASTTSSARSNTPKPS